MSETFLDTSALYALLDADDSHHDAARGAFEELAGADSILVTHNYVVVESAALVKARLGHEHLRHLSDLIDLAEVSFVDAALHETARQVFAASARRVSFVDSVSFTFMRRCRVDAAFTFDRHFTDQGFDIVPGR